MDPFTIAAGLGAIGSLLGGIGGFTAGQAQKKAMNAAAQQSLNESGVASSIALGQGERTEAKAATQAAANGGGLGGSSLGVLQDLSDQAMYQARAQVYSGVTQANNLRYQGQVAAANGTNQLIGSVVKAGSSLAGGFMQADYQKRMIAAAQKASGAGQPTTPGYGPW